MFMTIAIFVKGTNRQKISKKIFSPVFFSHFQFDGVFMQKNIQSDTKLDFLSFDAYNGFRKGKNDFSLQLW